MPQPGDKRFTFRLYEDNPADMELDRKMEKLVEDGKFRNKNEVLREGIALVYEASYSGFSGNRAGRAGFTESEIRETSRLIADEVISRIGGSIAGACENTGGRLPEEAEKMTDEMAVFLSGLNGG